MKILSSSTKRKLPTSNHKSKSKPALVHVPPADSSEDEEANADDGCMWHLGVDNSNANSEIPFRGKHEVNMPKTDLPIDIFHYYFDDKLIDEMVYQTNLYATQRDVNRPINLTKRELYIFLGINVTMTHIRYPA